MVEPAASLRQALARDDVAVIAELKRRSPSSGIINPVLSAGSQARAYVRGGASAISILTEPRHFEGTTADLESVRASVAIPLLKKDFHIDPLQVLEARAARASALLLIARALPAAQLQLLARVAEDVGIEVLIEVRDEVELALALSVEGAMIGVNNRDLETLEVDIGTSARLLPLVPSHRVAVAESGVKSRRDVERFAACGADAVLVGSSLSAAAEPEEAVRALTGVLRRVRDP